MIQRKKALCAASASALAALGGLYGLYRYVFYSPRGAQNDDHHISTNPQMQVYREEISRAIDALNDFLLHYGGHIGYSVRPDERRRGYASWMLAQGLDYCRSMGLRKVLITCLDTNEASRRTILHAGGVYESTEHEPNENENLERYWITLKGE